MQGFLAWHFPMRSSCAMISYRCPVTFDPVFRRMEDEPMEALTARVTLIQAEVKWLAQYLSTLSRVP